jgi:hypothetical protein
MLVVKGSKFRGYRVKGEEPLAVKGQKVFDD